MGRSYEHRGAYGVEPICKVLPIAPSTYLLDVFYGRRPVDGVTQILVSESGLPPPKRSAPNFP